MVLDFKTLNNKINMMIIKTKERNTHTHIFAISESDCYTNALPGKLVIKGK